MSQYSEQRPYSPNSNLMEVHFRSRDCESCRLCRFRVNEYLEIQFDCLGVLWFGLQIQFDCLGVVGFTLFQKRHKILIFFEDYGVFWSFLWIYTWITSCIVCFAFYGNGRIIFNYERVPQNFFPNKTREDHLTKVVHTLTLTLPGRQFPQTLTPTCFLSLHLGRRKSFLKPLNETPCLRGRTAAGLF